MGPVIIGERYDSKVTTEKFDVIIIGSGLSGLTVASLLSRQGKKVLVLEKHYTAGGFTHMFKRGEYALSFTHKKLSNFLWVKLRSYRGPKSNLKDLPS